MNGRWMTWILAFSVGLNMVLLVMVSYHLRQGWPAPRANAAPRSPLTHILVFDEKRLKLSPEQHARFREIREQWLHCEQNAKAAGVSRIGKLSALLVRDDVTTDALKPMFKEIREHSDDFFVRLTRMLQNYRAALTPNQRLTFNTMLQERFDALQRFTRDRYFDYERRTQLAIQNEHRAETKAANQAARKIERKVNRAARPSPKPAPAKPAAPAATPTP